MAEEASFAERILAWEEALDSLDYYQLLQVEQNASLGQIREAYHRQSRYFHPDRYFHLDDQRLKEAIYRISKRVTEAYVTLRDAKKRKVYDSQVAEGKQLRYTEQSEQLQQQKQQVAKTEKGRQLHQQGMQQMKNKDFVGAERTFKMALAYEPDNQLFKQLLEEAGRNIKTDYRVR